MAVWALGINHTTAPLDLRGRFAFALDQIAPTLHGLRQSLGSTSRHPGVETAIISTCNRTEIYCAGEQAAMDHTLGWLAQSGGVSPALLRSHSYTLEDSLVARHAFRVASGLDSMVLGEAQILGQMKDAVRAAETAGALGTTLNQLFQRSFAVAKEVRSSTEIGAHSIGLGAVERALKKRRHRPMFMVDLAVPRDIEPEVKALGDVYLYTVDDLATVVQTAQANRQAAVAQAEAIIDAGVQSFMHWMELRSPVGQAGGVVPLIQQLNAQTDEWRALEIARAKKLLAKGEDVDAVLEALSRGLTQKMLHGTLAELRAGDAEMRAQTAQTVSRLFLRSQSKTPNNNGL